MSAGPTANDSFQRAMERALELASRGPRTGANPRVGCVILDEAGNSVSEGWHQGSGTPHAEIMAIENLKKNSRTISGLTAVVTLEPCAHVGKTGPCAEALIKSGITRVVFSVDDPGQNSGGGSLALREAGIDVVEGVLRTEGALLIERWLSAVKQQRPWVTLKWASSLDGRSAASDSSSKWITGIQTRQRVHQDRSEHDAIIVGTNTVEIDDPSLTARDSDGTLYSHQPRAVVVGKREIDSEAAVRNHPGGFEHRKNRNLSATLSSLFNQEIRSVYVEGGPTVASAFIKERLVDEIHITLGPTLVGGPVLSINDIGVQTLSDAIGLEINNVERLGNDIFITARPNQEGNK